MMKKGILGLATLLMMGSCCAPCSKSAAKIGELENSAWKLVEFKYNPIEDSKITLQFDANEKMVYGTAPCNNFFGSYVLNPKDKKQNVEFHNMGSTRKLCPDTELEEAFVMSLQNVCKVELDGDNLILIDNKGEMTAVLEQ